MTGWRAWAGAFAVGALLGCATDIPPRDHTIQPSPVRLGGFDSFILRPLAVEKMAGDRGDHAAVVQLETELRGCLRAAFQALREQMPGDGATGRVLIVQPVILDLKKINAAERRWVGPLAGSSAVLLELRLGDAGSGETIAAPVFHARGDAWRGSRTPFAASDEAMVSTVAEEACGYARANL